MTQGATELQDALVVDVTVRGQAAFVGTAASVFAVVLAASGVLWFFYGFQRGWSMPGVFNPAMVVFVTMRVSASPCCPRRCGSSGRTR